MAFNIDFGAGVPANVSVVNGAISGSILLLQPNGTISVSDGSVSAGLAQDIEVLLTRTDFIEAGSVSVSMFDLAEKGYVVKSPIHVYGYSAPSVRVGSAETALSVPSLTKISDEDTLVSLRCNYDGENLLTSYINGVISTQATIEAANKVTIPNGSFKLTNTSGQPLEISTIIAREFIASASADTVKVGDSITFTGTFDADQNVYDIELIGGGIVLDVKPSITAYSTTEITLTIPDSDLPLDTAVTFSVKDVNGLGGLRSFTLASQDDRAAIFAVDPLYNDVYSKSLFDAFSSISPVTGFQLEHELLNGLTVLQDGTFEFTGAEGIHSFDVRIRDTSTNTWSALETVTIDVSYPAPILLTDEFIVSTDADSAIASVNVGADDGTLYIIASLDKIKPSFEQLKLFKDGYDKDAVRQESRAISSSGVQTFDTTGLSRGTYYYYAGYEGAGGEQSNIIQLKYSVLGVPVTPVISLQPTSGTVQESKSNSSHILSVAASPLLSLNLQRKLVGGDFEDIGTSANYDIRGNAVTKAIHDQAIYRYELEGEGGAIAYSDEITLTVLERPYINIDIPNFPDGEYTAVLRVEGTTDIAYDGLITTVDGKAKVETTANSGDVVRGDLYNETLLAGQTGFVRTVAT